MWPVICMSTTYIYTYLQIKFVHNQQSLFFFTGTPLVVTAAEWNHEHKKRHSETLRCCNLFSRNIALRGNDTTAAVAHNPVSVKDLIVDVRLLSGDAERLLHIWSKAAPRRVMARFNVQLRTKDSPGWMGWICSETNSFYGPSGENKSIHPFLQNSAGSMRPRSCLLNPTSCFSRVILKQIIPINVIYVYDLFAFIRIAYPHGVW